MFATVVLNEWSAPLRLNLAFTPDLTLELYGQPYIASGRFYRYGELGQPRDLDIQVYGEDIARPASVSPGNDAFDYASFRSNAVLRWEWRRGSTLYPVWQQNRGRSDVVGRRVRPGDLFDGLRADGDNFLAIKVSCWVAPH